MDPVFTPMLIGAGVGAMTDKDNPMRGAALGGALGYGGSALMGAGSAAAASPAGYGALPGMTAPSAQTAMLASQGVGLGASAIPSATQGAQAAMLAEQTGAFGMPGLLATGEAAAVPGSMTSGAFGMGKNLAFGGQNSTDIMKAGQAMSSMGQREPQPQQMPPPIIAAPMNKPQPLPFNSPYERQPQSYTYGQPSLLPGFRG